MPRDMSNCAANAKLRTVGHQLDTWWTTFWDHSELANQIYDESKTENWLGLKSLAIQMRFNGSFGKYHEAGKRLGEIWVTLIG